MRLWKFAFVLEGREYPTLAPSDDLLSRLEHYRECGVGEMIDVSRAMFPPSVLPAIDAWDARILPQAIKAYLDYARPAA